MPTYTYRCRCGLSLEMARPVDERNVLPRCMGCDEDMPLQVAAPLFRFAGRVTPGGGPDKFTADMLGIPLKELPSGLKTE